MPMIFAALLAGSVSVAPAEVPAQGRQEAILTLAHAAMVRIAARGSAGTACEIVDHSRGPFARAGVIGKTNCLLELLLDGGTYKLRLDSPAKAKGKVQLDVREFVRKQKPVLRLFPW